MVGGRAGKGGGVSMRFLMDGCWMLGVLIIIGEGGFLGVWVGLDWDGRVKISDFCGRVLRCAGFYFPEGGVRWDSVLVRGVVG